MALNPYNSYCPTYYQQPQIPYLQPQVQQNVSNGIVWVKDASEASSYPVAPNTAVALWDSSTPAIYLKQADAAGKPTIKTYDLVERKDVVPENFNGFATKQDVASLDESILAIKQEIDKISGDLYGIAGKKKVTKKIRDEEDDE